MQMGFQLLCCLTSWHISNHVRHNGDAMNCLRRATKPDGGEADKNQKSCKQPPPVLDNLISERHQSRLDIPAGLVEMFASLLQICRLCERHRIL